mgnify:FL=1
MNKETECMETESMETKSKETAGKGTDAMTTEAVKARMQSWIDRLHLEVHTEGGWFSEVYAAPAEYGSSKDGRVMGGTIYFLLGQEDVSHFHVIDCDEIWYFHEGCGVALWLLNPDGTCECRKLGCGEGEEPMVVVPKGAIFGAENLNPESYTLMSCATMPNFHYEGFRLVDQKELLEKFPKEEKLIRRMAFAHTDGQKELHSL